jgi:hypothetical protein
MTGDDVLEWMERNGFTVGEWQRDAIRRMDWSETSEGGPLWPAPRKPVLTRRVQRRRYSRARRRAAR